MCWVTLVSEVPITSETSTEANWHGSRSIVSHCEEVAQVGEEEVDEEEGGRERDEAARARRVRQRPDAHRDRRRAAARSLCAPPPLEASSGSETERRPRM
eukprot:scaffold93753_cov28-Tisochrysis_lutea.AAC.1